MPQLTKVIAEALLNSRAGNWHQLAKISARAWGLGFAIPINDAKPVINQLKPTGM